MSNTVIITVRCTKCNTVYQMQKFNSVAVGAVTNPNPGSPCPGCQKNAPAIVVAVAKAGN